MGRTVAIVGLFWVMPIMVSAQTDEAVGPQRPAGTPMVFSKGSNNLLAAGSQAIRMGRYDDGIRLTLMGLERPGVSSANRGFALSNICAAHAARNEPDAAIGYCSDALELDDENWHAYTNRSYAHWLKGMLSEALSDLDAATAINPRARQIAQIRGMINEAGLVPSVTMEDHQ